MRPLAIAYGNNRQAKNWTNKKITFDELKEERLMVTIRTPESAGSTQNSIKQSVMP